MLLSGIFGGYFLRHDILKHAFQISISKKTNQMVEFVIGDLEFDIVNSRISISKSNFEFQNIYINEEKTISLNRFDFNDIVLEGLSLYKLIFYRDIIAKKFTVSDPTFWFKQDETDMRFQENSRQIIRGLQHHPELLGNLVVKVDEIEITQGKIDIHRVFGNNETNGVVNFRLLLKDFNTENEDIFSENKFLFAEHHFLGLYDLNISLENGDDIKFDSLVLSSNTNTVVVNNLNVKVVDTSKFSPIKQLDGHINKVIFSGINLHKVHQLEVIDLDSLVIRDGNIIVSTKTNIKKNKSDRHGSPGIFKKLENITLGSINIEEVDVKVKNDYNDEFLSFNNLLFIVDSVVIDSSTFENKLPVFLQKQLKIGLKDLVFNDSKSGVNIDIATFDIDEQFHNIFITGANINDVIDSVHSYKFKADSLNLTGLDIERAMNGEINDYGVEVVNPVIDLDIAQIRKRSAGNRLSGFAGILNMIVVKNGNISIKDMSKLKLNLEDIEVSWSNAGVNLNNPIANINFKDLKVSFFNSYAHLNDKKIMMDMGEVSMLNENVNLNKLSIDIANNDIDLVLDIAKVNVTSFNLNNLISNNSIEIVGVKVNDPSIKGVYHKTVKEESRTEGKNGIKISVNDLEAVNGSFDINLLNSPLKSIDGDFRFKLHNIKYGEVSWIEQLGWDLSVSDIALIEDNFDITIDDISSNSKSNSVILDSVHVKSNSNPKTNRLHVNSLKLTKLSLSEIDFDSLIVEGKPIIKHIKVHNPDVSITIDKTIAANSNSQKKFNMNNLPIHVDDFTVNDLYLSANQIDVNDTSLIEVEGLDFGITLDKSSNIMDDITKLDIERVSLLKVRNNETLSINKIGFDSNNNDLGFESFYLSSVKPEGDSIIIKSSDAKFTDVDISTQLPLNININEFRVDGSSVYLKSGKKSSDKKTGDTKFSFPKKDINYLKINTTNFDSVNITHTSQNELKPATLSNLGFNVIGIRIDSTFMNEGKINFLNSATIDFSNNEFVSKDSLYATSISKVSYSSNNSSLIIDSIRYKPCYPAEEFFKKAIYQTSRTDLEVGNIVCNNFNVPGLINHKIVEIKSIDVFGLKARIFKDKQYPIKPGKYVKMPQDLILDIPRIVKIDTLNTYNSYIQYKELDEKSYDPGVVFLDSFNLSLYNISNDISNLDTTSMLIAKLNANVMGTSRLNLLVNFQMLSPAKKFTIKGHLNRINFTELNGLTQNLVGITMKQGWGELDIPLIRGDSLNTTGFIYFGYKKLKIELFNREKAQNTKGLTGSMAGLLLNDIFIKSNNPGWLSKTRPGEVYFKRDTQKFVVNYIWRSIQSGLMSTMGYNNREQRQEKRAWKKQNRKNLKRAARGSL